MGRGVVALMQAMACRDDCRAGVAMMRLERSGERRLFPLTFAGLSGLFWLHAPVPLPRSTGLRLASINRYRTQHLERCHYCFT